MDQIYLWIIILFAVILILDYSERFMKKSKKENFDNQSDPKKSLPIYYEENRLNVYEPPYSTNAININRGQHANFSNFGTNGVTPPFLKCPSCSLQFDCSNYPYDVDDKNGNVCTKCYEKVFLDNNNMPVYSRAAGKPRICKNLASPPK